MKPKKPDVAARQFIASMEMKCLIVFLSGNVCHSRINKLQAQPAHLCERINGPDWEMTNALLNWLSLTMMSEE